MPQKFFNSEKGLINLIQRKVFNKAQPSANGKNFIPLPSDALHYIHHPRMSPDKLFLYALIIDYYNEEDGYAYPSIETLSLKYGRSQDTTSEHLDHLKEVGLIDFPEKGHYIPLEPLPSDLFYEKFPEAWAHYKRKFIQRQERREAAKERMRKWREERGYV